MEFLITKRYMYINIRMNKRYKIKINTAFFFLKKYLASSDRKQMHYT